MSLRFGGKKLGRRIERLHLFGIYFVSFTTIGVAIYHSYRLHIKKDLVSILDEDDRIRQEKKSEFLVEQLMWLSKTKDPNIPVLHQESKVETKNQKSKVETKDQEKQIEK